MTFKRILRMASACGILALHAFSQIKIQPIGTYATGSFNGSASEISAFDPATKRLFTVNSVDKRLDILDIANPAAPTLISSVSILGYGGNPNSVATYNGVVAVAVEAVIKTDPGKVVFFDANGTVLSSVPVGALPDMVAFTHNGRRLLVANEGEPNNDYSVDPEGSISIVDMTPGAANLTAAHVRTAGFAAFNGQPLDPSIRIFGPGATTVAQDLEPEYITISQDSRTAWVTLQENNALAVVDIEAGVVTSLTGLGFKDHSLPGNGIDASDRDSAVNIANWPVFGMYQPDAIANFRVGTTTYLIMANEGDAREYTGAPGLVEEVRVGSASYVLDPTVFPNAATLKLNANLGRLNVTNKTGDLDGDGDFDRIMAFGARSISVRSVTGALLWDSGDQLERITAAALPAYFNSTHDSNTSFDTRSDNKGPEPEGIVVGKAFGADYAFVGLERIGGVVIFDLSNPTAPQFVQYVNNRNFAGSPAAGTAKDLGPEGLLFIPAEESPNGAPLLVVSNEISGTTTIFEVSKTK